MGMANHADDQPFLAFGHVRLQSLGGHALQHVVDFLLGCLGIHDDDHALAPQNRRKQKSRGKLFCFVAWALFTLC